MKKTVFIICSLILCLSVICCVQGLSQSGHYWTQHYGTRSILLSNSVIGGVEDLGAVYYNPARLAILKSPALLLSSNVYEWDRLTIEGAFGESADVSNSDFGGLPSLSTGTFKVGFLKNHFFAYSIITRQKTDFDISYKNETYGDVLDYSPGVEYLGAFVRINQKVRETWASISWAYPVSEHFSVGVTSSLAKLDQNRGTRIDLQALTEAGEVAIFRFDRNMGLNNYGLLWKAGIAWDINEINLGFTLTTPVIGLRGKGNYSFENFLSGNPAPSPATDVYSTNSQSDIPVKYKAPWATGFGISVPFYKKNKLYVSSEWYGKIPQYTIMQVQDHYSQSNGDTIRFRLIEEAKSVVNFGIGTEIYLNEKISGYLSFSTDYSTVLDNPTAFYTNEPVSSNSMLSKDYYHYAGGIVLKFKSADFTIGAAHTGCKQDFARPINFPDNDDDSIFDPNKTTTVKWDRWQLIFSFSVTFLDEFAKKVEKIIK